MNAAETCAICGHLWRRHDPGDGYCDAHAESGIGVCPCGRNMIWMNQRTAELSRSALAALRAGSGDSEREIRNLAATVRDVIYRLADGRQDDPGRGYAALETLEALAAGRAVTAHEDASLWQEDTLYPRCPTCDQTLVEPELQALAATRAVTADEETLRAASDMQADWFVREVKRYREIGMPLGCCGEWPECSHVLAWVDERAAARSDSTNQGGAA